MNTYILKQPDGSTFPPISIDELRKLASEGKITSEHTIQIEGGNAWHPASKIQGLVNPPHYSSSPAPSTNVQTSSQPSAAQDKMGSLKNAGKNMQGQIANKLPLVKGNLVRLKATIMRSNRNMIISASSVIAFLFILLIVFSGGGGVQGHVDSIKNVMTQMSYAINNGDADDFLDAFEEAVYTMESIQADSVSIKAELASMNQIELTAFQNQFIAAMMKYQTSLNPTDDRAKQLFTDIMTNPDYITRMQSLQLRMDAAMQTLTRSIR